MSKTSEDIKLLSCLGDKISQLDIREPYVWRLSLSVQEFEQLQTAIAASVDSHGGGISHLLTKEYALHIITYLAEWYKRCYQSGEQAYKAIDPDSEQLKTLWNVSGINIEKYVYRTAAGNHLWQYSMYVLGGLAIRHELGKTDDSFLKGLCRVLHGEEYALEDLDDESRAIAFRCSIKEKHGLYAFLSEIVNGKNPYHESEIASLNSEARLLMERIKHANDEVLKRKYRFEWIVNYEPGYDYLQRRLRLWFNPEEVGGGLHHYLRYDRVLLWGFRNPENMQRLFISLRFLDDDEVVRDVNFDRPIVSYVNTGETGTGFVAHGVDNYGTCHHIPIDHFNKIEIWAKDNDGNTRCIQEEKCAEFMQMWRVSPYDDEWSNRPSAQKTTAVVFSGVCQLKLNDASGEFRMLPFRDKKLGVSADFGWCNIYDNVTVVDEEGNETTLYNRIGYDQICTRHYNVIAYDEAGKVKHIGESDDEDFDAVEESVDIIFDKDDIVVRHFATKTDIRNAQPESDDAAELIQFKTQSGVFEEWTDVNTPQYGIVNLRIFVKGRQIPYRVFYVPGISKEQPLVRDFEKAQIKFNNFVDGKIVETLLQDNIMTGDTPIAPTKEIVVGSDFDYIVIDVYRPTLIREVCRNGKVLEIVDNKDVVIPYLLKDELTVNCFTEKGYQSYKCKGMSSIFPLIDDMEGACLDAWANGDFFEAAQLDSYAPGCLKVAFGSTDYKGEDVTFYKWNYWEKQELVQCEYAGETEPNRIIFQSLAGNDTLACILPTRGIFRPFGYKKQEISAVKCFDVALAHKLYFFILTPFSKIDDYRTELYEPLLEARGGILSEDDKKGLLRFAEEFKFDWKERYKIEI